MSLNENDIGDFKTFLKISPPLRVTENDRLSLINGIKDGLINVIVSDHKPEDEEDLKDYLLLKLQLGLLELKLCCLFLLNYFTIQSLTLKKIIETLTINPSKILKIKKGSLKKGCDADICVFDLNKPWVVKAEKLRSKSKNTAIEDRKLQGKVLMTFLMVS